MARSEEFQNRLKKWEEEYAADPQKTEITKGDLNNLRIKIMKLQEAERKVAEREKDIDDFLRG